MPDFEPSTFKQHSEELDFLKDQGFAINPYNKKSNSLDEIWEYQEYIRTKRDSLSYPIDGLVVKLDDNVIATQLGAVGKTPRSWCAIKFPAEEKTTRILGVTWQIGRTGKLTPVAELEPVELAGTVVKRATLHNYKEFVESDLHELDTLVVRKAGDIIPEVVAILDGLRHKDSGVFISPIICPSCNTELEKSETEVDILCKNSDNCLEQIKLRLSYYTGRNMANIPGLSDKIIERFIVEFGIHDIADLYSIDWKKVANMEGFGKKSADNLQLAIESSRTQKDSKFLASLGIDGVGEEVAKLIIKKLYEKQQNTST
jgi:DNA ligase (NAD+)